ncbi:MAG: hypothetical protein LUC93_03050 [Planctomycetaceae bacterium]|nr:hypothetical protein [Planctomycetaceae bacterium]
MAIGTANHDELENRGLSDQHPSGSVTHRERPLDGVLDSMETAVADLQNKSYDHIQEVPSEEWRIVHNLGVRHPLITIFDATGIQTNGAPDWPNATENDVVVHFANALTGTARVVG